MSYRYETPGDNPQPTDGTDDLAKKDAIMPKNDETPPPDWLRQKRAERDADLDEWLANPEDADTGEGFDWFAAAIWAVAGFLITAAIIWWRLRP